MRYISTNGQCAPVSFQEAALLGLAGDGGLFLPETIPALPADFWRRCPSLSFAEIAEEVAAPYVVDEIPRAELRSVVREALDFDAPLIELSPDLRVLELFHGPTLAFKDIGARFMARVIAYLRRDASRPLTVLVATSGDTGSAVAHGFYNVPGTRVVLLYPSGKVSRVQEQQLTTIGGNVTTLEVDGVFDDCQRMVKAAFRDSELRASLDLTSANSINIARLIPQMFAYVYAFAQVGDVAAAPIFAVPSGNFGHLTAGVLAHRMGLPARGFVAATNANDVVPTYLRSGVFTARPSQQTLSSAMDVGDPSNFARLLALYGGDHSRMEAEIQGYGFSNAETLRGMRTLYERFGYIADPHTAVGYLGLAQARRGAASTLGVVLATAHPAKFAEACQLATGRTAELPERLRACLELPKRAERIAATDAALRDVLLHGG